MASSATSVLAIGTGWRSEPISSFLSAVENDRFRVHRVVETSIEADIVLLVDQGRWAGDGTWKDVRLHTLVKERRETTFIYSDDDSPWCVIPGLYTSMPKRSFNRQRQRSCCYIQDMNPFISVGDTDPDILYSFIGRANWPVRKAVLALSHPRQYLEETHRMINPSILKNAGESDYAVTHYAEILSRSKFVVCPRGVGTSSYRLFETMRAGRVPIILADQWVAPDGPDWAQFSVMLPECDAYKIPEVCDSLEARWPEMAEKSRSAWEDWFAEDVLFHRMTESILDILHDRRIPEAISQRVPHPRLMRSHVGKAVRTLESRARRP